MKNIAAGKKGKKTDIVVVTLKYCDEKDRAYGLGGMAACLVFLENEDFIDSIDIDAPTDGGIRMAQEFFHPSNQNLSAKAVWQENLSQFEIVAGMLVSNILSRALVRNKTDISRELTDLLLTRLKEEGKETCSLEADEVKDIFYKTYSFFHRIFSHHEVALVMETMVDKLMQERVLGKDYIVQVFGALMRR